MAGSIVCHPSSLAPVPALSPLRAMTSGSRCKRFFRLHPHSYATSLRSRPADPIVGRAASRVVACRDPVGLLPQNAGSPVARAPFAPCRPIVCRKDGAFRFPKPSARESRSVVRSGFGKRRSRVTARKVSAIPSSLAASTSSPDASSSCTTIGGMMARPASSRARRRSMAMSSHLGGDHGARPKRLARASKPRAGPSRAWKARSAHARGDRRAAGGRGRSGLVCRSG